VRTREEINAYHREWSRKNPDKVRGRYQKYEKKRVRPPEHVDKLAGYHRIKRRENRIQVLTFFGAECVKCGYSADYRALQIDHIQGDGAKHRKSLAVVSLGPAYFLREIKSNPESLKLRFQVLCANCNLIKRCENKEFGPNYKHWVK
jgi:hypothetical protein